VAAEAVGMPRNEQRHRRDGIGRVDPRQHQPVLCRSNQCRIGKVAWSERIDPQHIRIEIEQRADRSGRIRFVCPPQNSAHTA